MERRALSPPIPAREERAAPPCPNLDEGRVHDVRASPARLPQFGIPLREGKTYLGDICELNFTKATQREKTRAAWDLEWEDVLGSEDEYTIPEVIVLVARMRGWL